MIVACVLSEYIVDSVGRRVSRLRQKYDHPATDAIHDNSGQDPVPTVPNVAAFLYYPASQAVMDAVEADNEFYVLWSEEINDEQ